MRPLPYPEPERLVGLWEVHLGANAPLKSDLLSRPTYRAWAAASSTLEGISRYTVGEHTASGSGAGQRLRGARVTPSLRPVAGPSRTRPTAHRR